MVLVLVRGVMTVALLPQPDEAESPESDFHDADGGLEGL